MKKLFLISFLFIATSSTVFAQLNTSVSNNQVILLNGQVLNTSSPILLLNDRLMVPFREFAEAMGAAVNWDGNYQRITIFRNNLYSIIHIGNPIVQHGEFAIVYGNINFITQNNSVMDSPATLVNGITYIPLRAIAESLGATVEWNPNTSTAFINTLKTTPSSQLIQNDNEEYENDLPSNFGDFTNISHFSTISSRQAQARFNDSNSYPFILVVYNSDQFQSKLIVPEIQDIAQRVGYRIFGLDRNSSNNIESENSWIWNFVREGTFSEPSILFVYNRNRVEIETVQNINNLDQRIRNFRISSETGITPGDFSNTSWFTNISSNQVQQMYQNFEEFIVVLYDSRANSSIYYVPVIKAAARDTQHRIFAVDIDANPNFVNHFGFTTSIDTNIINRMPMLVLVYNRNNSNRIAVYDRPLSVAAARSLINEFLNNSLFYTGLNLSQNNRFVDLDHNRFRNTSAVNILNMFNRGEDFVVVVYDSNHPNSIPIAESIRGAAILSTTVHAVNLSSNAFNHSYDDLWWLRFARGNNSITAPNPVIIHFRNGQVVSGPFTFNHNNTDNALREAYDFIRRATN